MECTIADLWNGNLVPRENCGAGDPKVDELIALMERNRENLQNELSKQQKEIFEKYTDCVEEYVCLISMHAFRDGFILAGKLMTEVLSG